MEERSTALLGTALPGQKAAEKPTILLADDDPLIAQGLQTILQEEGFQVSCVANGDDALIKARERQFEVAIVDLRMPGTEGLPLLRKLHEVDPSLPIILMTGYASIPTAVEAIQEGAYDFFEKPLRRESLLPRLKKAIDLKRMKAEIHRLREELQQLKYPPIVGRSFPIRRVLQQTAAVAATPSTTVLIQGESGVGKELVARAIHDTSSRREKLFVAINCAALTESLLEAELFGYEKGAFTGASSNGKQGLFSVAEGGTLFLDEVSELAIGLQAKLLRALQEKTIRKVGGEKDIPVDVRVVASTNKDLAQAADSGKFRKDLFFRLHVMAIEVPRLADRKEDIPLLAHYFLEQYNRELGKGLRGFSEAAIQALFEYAWPGNVRELRNTIERAAIVAKGNLIQKSDLLLRFTPEEEHAENGAVLPLSDLSIRGMERSLIQKVLVETRGNISRAAEVLGINRTTLYNKMRVYEVRAS